MRGPLLCAVVGFCLVVLASGHSLAAEQTPFYLTLDPPPAPELSTAQSLAAFQLAPGFAIELVVAEPLVEDPVAMTWDEAGRLYVVEMRGYMPDAYGNGEREPIGVVARLTDSTGDGRLDKREVLLDKLVLPRALAIVNEGLLIGEPPQLWLCPTSTGRSQDIDCRAKRNLGSYGDQPGSAEHAENGLLLGLDNWLYSAKSNRRLRLSDGELIEEPTLFRGQWGISQDDLGRLYYNTNSNLLTSDAFDAQQVVAGGNQSAPGLGQVLGRNDVLHAARINPGVNRAYVPGVLREDGRLNRPTSASGNAVYRGDQFGPAHKGQVFIAEPAANAIAQLALSRDGLKVSSEHLLYASDAWGKVEFLASTDERFRPVDVKVGPDGALYVVDMYRGIIQDHVFLSDQLRAQALERKLDRSNGKGRIWRIAKNTSTPVLPSLPKLNVDYGESDSESLVAMLGHANGWHRDTAQRLLLARSDRRLKRQLVRAVKSGETWQAVHAIWTLAGRDELNRSAVLAASSRDLQPVQLAAARAGHLKLKRTDLIALLGKVTDSSIRQQLLFGLASHNEHPEVLSYLTQTLITNGQDAYIPAAIKAAALGQELSLLRALSEPGQWSQQREHQTKFVELLVAQGFRNRPDSASELLDFVQSEPSTWLQIAVLDGIYRVSRADGFRRATLKQPHPIFAIDEDTLWPAVGRARRAITWPEDTLAVNAKPLSPMQQQAMRKGQQYFVARCATCHGADGLGIVGLAPPLADSLWVTGSSERLARIILHGLQGPIEVAGSTWNGVMPGHAAVAEFDDEVASGLMTYLHRAWGHTERAIEPLFVAQIRQQTADRRSLWTASELLELDTNTHYRRYEGRYGRPGFALEFFYNGQGLEVKSGIFNGPMVEQKEDHFLFEPRALGIEFVLSDDGKVVGARMQTSDGEVQMPRMES